MSSSIVIILQHCSVSHDHREGPMKRVQVSRLLQALEAWARLTSWRSRPDLLEFWRSGPGPAPATHGLDSSLSGAVFGNTKIFRNGFLKGFWAFSHNGDF